MTKTPKFVAVTYVGAKPAAHDNVAHSGAQWNGHGDVQLVEPRIAKALINYPDQWALAKPADAKHLDDADAVEVMDEAGDVVLMDPKGLRRPIERMSKTELRALAMKNWRKTLPDNASHKAMIDQIEEWQADLDTL